MPIPGAYWVRERQLLAGPYPDFDDTREQLQALLDAGVTFFLDLTREGEAPAYAPTLMAEAAARGIAVTHSRMTIVDMNVPGHDFMDRILDTLDAALDEGHMVYVHCLGGIGRTGTVVGCYLARHGIEGQAALDRISQLRGGRAGSPETPAQVAMVRGWAAHQKSNNGLI